MTPLRQDPRSPLAIIRLRLLRPASATIRRRAARNDRTVMSSVPSSDASPVLSTSSSSSPRSGYISGLRRSLTQEPPSRYPAVARRDE